MFLVVDEEGRRGEAVARSGGAGGLKCCRGGGGMVEGACAPSPSWTRTSEKCAHSRSAIERKKGGLRSKILFANKNPAAK